MKSDLARFQQSILQRLEPLSNYSSLRDDGVGVAGTVDGS